MVVIESISHQSHLNYLNTRTYWETVSQSGEYVLSHGLVCMKNRAKTVADVFINNQIFAHWRWGSPDNQLKRITGLIFPSVSGSFLAIFFMNFLHFCFYFETVSLCVGTGESASEKALCWADYLFFFLLGRLSLSFFWATWIFVGQIIFFSSCWGDYLFFELLESLLGRIPPKLLCATLAIS